MNEWNLQGVVSGKTIITFFSFMFEEKQNKNKRKSKTFRAYLQYSNKNTKNTKNIHLIIKKTYKFFSLS